MAATPSTMMPLGTVAPDFSLPNVVTGEMVTLQSLKSDKATVIMFICNHCPYVKHIQAELVKLANHYQPQGVSFIAINSNDAANYPDDAPDKMKQVTRCSSFSSLTFTIIYDLTLAAQRRKD
jgi:thiol-disulfide isomerase/thioredoxin